MVPRAHGDMIGLELVVLASRSEPDVVHLELVRCRSIAQERTPSVIAGAGIGEPRSDAPPIPSHDGAADLTDGLHG